MPLRSLRREGRTHRSKCLMAERVEAVMDGEELL